jgi:hypothetical protein
MSQRLWITLGTVVATTAAIGGAVLVQRRRTLPASPEQPLPNAPGPMGPAPAPDPAVPAPKPGGTSHALPTAADVKGDLVRNWGKTPADLRPLFLKMEEASGIVGAGRIFSLIAHRESRYQATAHNGNDQPEQAERDASAKAYANNKARNPPLAAGEAAAAFGSGGLFGALAPYFLWTGVQELGAKAPLLGADPRVMFEPRIAGFAACVYLQRLLANYDIQDHADIKVGWGSVSLLKPPGRGGETYHAIRTRFLADAATLGIDLTDVATIPRNLRATAWPGVAKVFAALVGHGPTPELA